MADKILIIGREDDQHIPYVEKHLSLPVMIIDPANCISGTELSYEYSDGKFTISYNGVNIENIRSVWYRKPMPVWGDNLPVDPAYRHYSETAIFAHMRELYMHFSDALWISNYYALRRADQKGLQVEVASKLGFHIPDTISTSDASAAQKFVKDHSATIIKSLAATFPNTPNGEPTMFYSKKIYPDQDFNYEGLNLAPAIFQQAIDHDFEIRVTVVGEQAFAAAIHIDSADESSSIRDWRPASFNGKLRIEAHQLPVDLESKCINLVKELGLNYGAIDLIYDKKGEYWFLENNPNGEWAFVEHATGQPIGKEIAALLSKGITS